MNSSTALNVVRAAALPRPPAEQEEIDPDRVAPIRAYEDTHLPVEHPVPKD
jgi:hypothetical protein